MKNLNLKIIVFGKFVTLRGGGAFYAFLSILSLESESFLFFKLSRFWDFVILRFQDSKIF